MEAQSNRMVLKICSGRVRNETDKNKTRTKGGTGLEEGYMGRVGFML